MFNVDADEGLDGTELENCFLWNGVPTLGGGVRSDRSGVGVRESHEKPGLGEVLGGGRCVRGLR